MTNKRFSSKKQILNRIRSSGLKGVANHELIDITLRYGARITELRQEGHDIRIKRVYKDNHATGTYLYYLEPKDYKQQDLIPKERWMF